MTKARADISREEPKAGSTRTTRTCDLAGAAFYLAHGLRFKALEMRSPLGKGGAINISLVFSGGSELTALADEFQTGNPEVSLKEIKAFVDLLARRLKAARPCDGGEA